MRALGNKLVCPNCNGNFIKNKSKFRNGNYYTCENSTSCSVIAKKFNGQFEFTDQKLRSLRREGHKLAEYMWGEWKIADKASMYKWMSANSNCGHFSLMDDEEAQETVIKLKQLLIKNGIKIRQMTKLTITYIGTPKEIQTKFGAKEKNSIKTTEYGDKYLSYWVNPFSKNWKEGDVIEVAEVKEREWEGKKYYDIVLPKVENQPATPKELGQILTKMGLMNAKLDQVIGHLSGENRLDRTSDGSPMPNFEPTVDDLDSF